MEKDVEFLEEKVRGVLEPLVASVLKEDPEEPVEYMINWLNAYMGISNDGNAEKEELMNLRKEIKKYKEKYKEKEMQATTNKEDTTHNSDNTTTNNNTTTK
jgi:hypothetical protein